MMASSIVGAGVAAQPALAAKKTKDRAHWMSGHYGLMVHWLAPGPPAEHGPTVHDLNTAVDRFDVPHFLHDFAQTKAQWLIFTIGQNTTYYCSPNATLDRLAGPGHCSHRDLVLEIAQGVHTQGKRFIAYLPAEVDAPEVLHEPFAWNPADQSEFQRRYCAFIREYAQRFGKLLNGWWFDGCYTWPVFPNSARHWPLWTAAARAGNPAAALAFNDGSLCCGNDQPIAPDQDYLSGETEVLRDGKLQLGRQADAPLYLPTSRFCEGTRCQWHSLVPIDAFWAHGKPGPMEPPRYTDQDLDAFLHNCLSVGGAVTLNVGIYQEGGLGTETLVQLQRITV